MVDKHRDAESLPPIPDGGLATSMPDWLQRPPAWQEVDDDEPAQSNHDRSNALLEAETSIIDPRAFLTEDDLPPWLRGLRRPARPTREDATGQGRDVDGKGLAEAKVGASSRFVPRSMMSVSQVPSETAVRKQAPSHGRLYPAPSPRGARGQGLQLVLLLLAGALLAAVLAIVMLLI